MKLRCTLLSIVFCFTLSLQAQDQHKMDSLSALLTGAEIEEKISLLIELSMESARIDAGQGIDYADEAVQLARQIGNTKLIYEAGANMGGVYQILYRDEEALREFKSALEFSEEVNYPEGKADALYQIGRQYYYLEMLDSSHYFLDKAIELADKIGNEKVYSDALLAKAGNYREEGNLADEMWIIKQVERIKLELNDLEGLNQLYSDMGGYFFYLGQYEEAITNYQKAKNCRLKLGRTFSAATMDAFIGNCYTAMSRYDQALGSYHMALPVFEEFNDSSRVASVYNGMAIVYEEQKRYDKAEELYLKKLDIDREMGNQMEIALTYNNLGILFSRLAADTLATIYGPEILDSITQEPTDKYLKFFAKAIDYFQQSIEISRKLDMKQRTAHDLNNIGVIYLNSGKLNQAQPYFEQSLVISEEIQDADQLATSYLYLGEITIHKGNYDQSMTYLNQSLEYARKINAPDHLEAIYLNMSNLFTRLNNYKKALEYYKLFNTTSDSIQRKNFEDLTADFESRKQEETKRTKQVIDNINKLWEQDKTLQASRIKTQRIIIASGAVVLLLIILFTVYIFMAYRNKRKANRLLTEQKEEIASQRDEIEAQRDEIEAQRDEILKQKEILTRQNDQLEEQKQSVTDSINYASKIQTAILPSDELLRHYLPKHFVLFKPRDIVSGDFYWIGAKQEKVIVAAVDCTGHGVPGAFMSVLGSSMLNEIMGRIRKVASNEILDELRDLIIISLHQSGRWDEAKDGMDMSLCIFDLKKLTLQFSGAQNPLYLVRDNELIEYKGDNMPIGIHARAGRSFSKTDISLQKGDAVYIFSDGYADQFGGPLGKKFKYSQFKEVILGVQDKIMHDQKEALEHKINDWMTTGGNGSDQYEQVDDILVIGIKI